MQISPSSAGSPVAVSTRTIGKPGIGRPIEPGLIGEPGGFAICTDDSVWPKPSRILSPQAFSTCSITSGLSGSPAGVLVRVHSECLTGDVLGSLRCDCGAQLEQALKAIAEEGCGVVVYLRGHEGRGIGLGHKIRAYAFQERGLDTADANTAQGLPVDSRSYGVGAQILGDLGVRRLRLITNNPDKIGGLEGYALEIVGRVAVPAAVTPHNLRYLVTKRDRMGHQLEVDVPAEAQ